MSDNKTRVFYALARMPRDFSAKDLQERMYIAAPRDVLAELRQGGQVRRSFRAGREQFYSVVPESAPPVDARAEAVRSDAKVLQQKRKKRALMARARSMRKLKQLKKQRGE